ncbi:MAG: ComEC/Rec2 family competence protein [SAR324 cluster bacterium]|nr:ComEC/Rec2 family competence protein [SAR324 cluster bacterium]
MPFWVALAAFLFRGLTGQVRLDLSHVFLACLLALAWLIGRRLWPLALLFAMGLTPAAFLYGWALPERAAAIGALRGEYLRLDGTVREARVEGGRAGAITFLLGETTVAAAGAAWAFPELEATFPGRTRRPYRFYRSRLRVGGRLKAAEYKGGRLRLALTEVKFHRHAVPISPRGGERVRVGLRDRAAYYLSHPALAVYLPIVLGIRQQRSPEGREVVGAFRRVGISHLFAISGLHIGLLFLILAAVHHFSLGILMRGQGWVRAQALARVGIMALIWAYIALIGFPVPAVRAAVMGSMVVWSGLFGTRTPRIYLLIVAGLLLLAVTPTALYDLSFQLSFLAYFFLLCALEFRPGASAGDSSGPQRALRRLLYLAGMNLLMTLFIMAGIWPIIAVRFGQISLLVFLGNLVMIPILSVVVLPAGILALVVSLLFLGQVPGGWVERAVFGGLEIVLSGWVFLVRAIDAVGGGLVFQVAMDWGQREFFLYYLLLLLAIFIFWRFQHRGRNWRAIFLSGSLGGAKN